ncbi:MAG: discoidin domain-containing protein [Deltaproteobacteria bacterium]|nr:discoidin domain-containing protein [Deltaproteobacteria bacterium]
MFVLAVIASRLFFLFLPSYHYVYYDESIPGLMALDMLEGHFPLVYWAHPYLGSLDALAAAALFKVFGPSTLMLRVSVLVFFGIYAVFAWKLAQEATGRRFPWYLAIFLVIPPLALSEYSLSTIGGYTHTLALGTVLLYLTSRLLVTEDPARRRRLYVAWGLVAGLGLWTFLMIVPYLATCLLVLFLKDRGAFFRRDLLWGLAALVVGSLPLWIWNLGHDFQSFTRAKGGAGLADLPGHFRNLFEMLCTLLGRTHEYIQSDWHGPLTVVMGVVLAGLALGWLVRDGRDFLRAVFTRRRAPGVWDLLVLSFAAAALSYVFSEKGSLVLTRYGLPLYSSLPILLAGGFHRLGDRHRAWHAVLVPLLLVMLVPFNFAYVRENFTNPHDRDLTRLISFLEEQGLRHAYAHYTVAHTLTFESGGRIICADFGGFRNVRYLRSVDTARAAAIITNDAVGVPHADHLASHLGMLYDSHQRSQVGKFTVFHGFSAAPTAHLDITEEVASLSAGPEGRNAPQLTDGNISTKWRTARAQSARDRLVIRLSRPQPVSKLTLYPGNSLGDFPRSLLVEVSSDGRTWRIARRAEHIVESFLRFRGRPRLFGSGQVDVYLDGEMITHLRLGPLREAPGHAWTVGEVVIYKEGEPRPDRDLARLREVLARQEGATVLTYPWVNAGLQKAGGLPGKMIPLYTDLQLYANAYRRWDFAARTLDFAAPHVFVVYPEDEPGIVAHLERRAIAFEGQALGDFRIIRTQAVAKLSRPHRILGQTDCAAGPLPPDLPGIPATERESYYGLAARLQPGQAVDGFVLDRRLLPADLGAVRVFLAGADGKWREDRAHLLHNSYWSDHQLLEFTPHKTKWYFTRPVRAAKLLIVLNRPVAGQSLCQDGLALIQIDS